MHFNSLLIITTLILGCFSLKSRSNKAVPGNYTGPLRPQIHYSPPKGFMNDPNGMFLDGDGVWHLYYQYNPTGIVAGDQHWGHATSKDLYHWVNQPIALYPVNASAYIFSGSCVVDSNNTSGFFPNQNNGVVAIYTLATYEPILLQSQAIAYSRDGGYTFTVYKHNPVLDIGSSQFRDPKVIWYQDHWVMVVSYASEFTIGFFTSKDLKTWDHASNFSHHGLLGIQYECPNLVEMPVKGSDHTMWVLQISINPGAPLGGSISQIFPGYFDGYKFTAVDGAARITDFGKDNYAGQFFYGIPSGQDAVSIAWASNWEYSQLVPTGQLENWRSAMTVPRRNYLKQIGGGIDWVMVTAPYDLSPVLGKQLAAQNLGNGSMVVDYSAIASNAIYFEANATKAVDVGTLSFSWISPVSGEYIRSGVTFGPAQNNYVNRGGIMGFDNDFFTDKMSVASLEGVTKVSGILDRSLFELFLNDGEHAATNSYFPFDPLTLMTVTVAGIPKDEHVSVAVWSLESAWKQYENRGGIVKGNSTASSRQKVRRYQDAELWKLGF